ncbi:hypothetical protein J7T55_010928 [Diaporthe amygdali]|uniref:uncharacterized protein n=1 Tax=Phomopsis amygdali TaxID=1214568 RepID=UPI0022FE4B87|nr:uncharacterized protein J7T55_010928 [Diaporthe amygdali]KAJ0104462.1 hypothetical protein J7T55_010928 [Diaporthe amygdali]
MKCFIRIFAVVAVIMAYERKMAIASDERMATLCFDELVNFPYINTCFYKPTTTHLGQCNFLAHLFDGIHCNDPPILKFPPTKITVDDPYTCYLFKAENCTAERGVANKNENVSGSHQILDFLKDFRQVP